MRYFTLLVTDVRYRVPSLVMRPALDDLDAIAFARHALLTNPCYRSIEIWEGERFVGLETIEEQREAAREEPLVFAANDGCARPACLTAPMQQPHPDNTCGRPKRRLLPLAISQVQPSR
jgi:hypothetical protein